MRSDAADQGDLGERVRDCIVCGYEPPSMASFHLHRRNCEKCSSKALEIGDFVKCPYCEYASASLYSHLNKLHQINKRRAKELGIEACSLNYKRRQRRAVSASIMASPEERQRRARLLGELNKTKGFRERASRTAIKTSARKDIQEQRAEQLAKWRRENPGKFRKRCTERMLAAPKQWKKTKPEKFLLEWLEEEYSGVFEWGKMLRSVRFEEAGHSDRKQIDFRSKDRLIYIEVDGPFHFENLGREEKVGSIRIEESIARTRSRDKLVEQIVVGKNKCLIRVGYVCWANSTGRIRQEVLDKIREIVDNKQTGVFKLGECYGEDNCL